MLEKSLSSTFEASEFYNINNAKQIDRLPPTTATLVTDLGDTHKSVDEKDLNKSERSVRGASLEFISNMFNKMRRDSSRSPNRSKSPTKQAEKPQLPNTVSTSSTPMPIQPANAPTDVHEIIRNELKKIVQMQHDTVMSFLNNGHSAQPVQPLLYAQPPPAQLQNNLNQQLTSILRQQQIKQAASEPGAPPVEFIIETKIKTVDSLTGQPNSVSSVFASSTNNQPVHQNLNLNQSYFEPKQQKQAKQSSKLKSSLIKIPLLTIKQTEQTTELSYENRAVGLPNILASPKSKVNGLKLLDFNADHQNQVQSSAVFYSERIAPVGDHDEVNRHVKEYIEMNTRRTVSTLKSFPLLRFGEGGAEGHEKQSTLGSYINFFLLFLTCNYLDKFIKKKQ